MSYVCFQKFSYGFLCLFFPMVSPWLPYGHGMVLNGLPLDPPLIFYDLPLFPEGFHGFPMVSDVLAILSRWPSDGSQWVAYGFLLVSIRFRQGFHKIPLTSHSSYLCLQEVFHGHPMGFLWPRYGLPLAIRRFSMVCLWLPYGFRMVSAWFLC